MVNGSRFHLDIERLKKSVNYRLIEAGLVFPTYYPGAFSGFALALTEAVVEARQAGRGVWSHDKTNKGVDVYDLTAGIWTGM